MTAYNEDLAFIHHVGFSAFAQSAAPGILNELRNRGIHSGLVVDLGCGSGILARELIQAGYQVLGVDISPDMIAIAKKTAPEADFQVASLLDVEMPPCNAVTALGECINYAPGLSGLFPRVYKALAAGGIFLFDTAEPGRLGGATRVKSFTDQKDWAVLHDAIEDASTATLERRITTFRRAGDLYRRSEEIHHLKLYKAVDLAAFLREQGFRAKIRRGYGDYRLQPGHAALIAHKPEK